MGSNCCRRSAFFGPHVSVSRRFRERLAPSWHGGMRRFLFTDGSGVRAQSAGEAGIEGAQDDPERPCRTAALWDEEVKPTTNKPTYDTIRICARSSGGSSLMLRESFPVHVPAI